MNSFSMLAISRALCSILGSKGPKADSPFRDSWYFRNRTWDCLVNMNEILWTQKTVMIFGTTVFLQNHKFILDREDPERSAYSYWVCSVCVWVQGNSMSYVGGKDI